MSAAASADSLDDLFLRLEAAGVMLRLDPDLTPTMAKAPTLGSWELDLIRTVEKVVCLGHIDHVTEHEVVLKRGVRPLIAGSLVVHCAASGLGYPCFGAALAGFVEATRDDDRERNRLCPRNSFADTPASWARMQVRGAQATSAFSEPDIDARADRCALNSARIEPSQRTTPAVQEAMARVAAPHRPRACPDVSAGRRVHAVPLSN